ncbi:hypothetical protein [Aestuariispira insulae]|uniref:Uncharacterized protein n=1 Tax=Aestuariispira insulae TaxID=1461337 RepID=A0A3D9HNH2_9PROT|nr:hypothetical protein [Aestuariispira insulae]RED50965.1 hypothetical protein DFP90_104238 [Aestuariispira insulae]
MTDLSRDELKAHLSAVEAQVRAALRIVAAESKSVQQAHSALRADLAAALVRLQADMNAGNNQLESKVNKIQSDVLNLGRQRRMIVSILAALAVLFGISVGLLAGGSWYLLQDKFDFDMMKSSTEITMPLPKSPDLGE